MRERDGESEIETERAREREMEGMRSHVVSSRKLRGLGVVLQYRSLVESLSTSIKKQIKTARANYDDPCYALDP